MKNDPHLDLLHVASELDHLAECLYSVGNPDLAKKLHTLSDVVNASNDAIRNRAAEDLNERIRIGEQSTMNMVSAALAGIKIAGVKDEA